MPHDDDAKRLARTSTTSPSSSRSSGVEPPHARPQGVRLGPLPPQGDRRHRPRGAAPEEDGRRGRDAQRRLLRARRLMGLRGRSPRASRCRCGEQGLLPEVRELDGETIVVADGFSCKTQIEQGRRAARAPRRAGPQACARAGAAGPPGPKPGAPLLRMRSRSRRSYRWLGRRAIRGLGRRSGARRLAPLHCRGPRRRSSAG